MSLTRGNARGKAGGRARAARNNFTGLLILICLLWFAAPLHVHGVEEQSESEESVIITWNDSIVDFEDLVLLENKRVFVPIRLFVDRFGGTIDWDEETREVTIETVLGAR